jgi:hypothetical protein
MAERFSLDLLVRDILAVRSDIAAVRTDIAAVRDRLDHHHQDQAERRLGAGETRDRQAGRLGERAGPAAGAGPPRQALLTLPSRSANSSTISRKDASFSFASLIASFRTACAVVFSLASNLDQPRPQDKEINNITFRIPREQRK